jgi:hypothetical protein
VESIHEMTPLRSTIRKIYYKLPDLRIYLDGRHGKAIREIEREFPMPKREIRRLRNRVWILDLVRKGGIGAEIGVFRGHFSELICRHAAPRKLYLIDPWTTLGEHFNWSSAYTSFGKLTTAAAMAEAQARTARYPKTEAILIEGRYPDCADQIGEMLDFAYLDASHRYDSTLLELRHLEDQIKADGVIIGDDWSPDPSSKHHGVYRAVTQFIEENNWELIKAGPGEQWAIRRKT